MDGEFTCRFTPPKAAVDRLANFLTMCAARYTGDDWVAKYARAAAKELRMPELRMKADDFARRLRAASEAHHAFEAKRAEKEAGWKDEAWATWYANHMLTSSG